MDEKLTNCALVVILSMVVATAILMVPSTPKANAIEAPNGIRISGVVKKPLNYSYAELLTFPMVSELVTLECVDRTLQFTFNWTGVPLFHLLALAQVKKEAYDVIFRASDNFSSSITIEEALRPTTILALKGNGTVLSEIGNIKGGFRIVIPGKWGYKWVRDIEEIEVVDYDYKGNYEQAGLSDEADIPGFVQPSIAPPLQAFDVSFGQKETEIQAFSNVSIALFDIDHFQKKMIFNITAPPSAYSFVDFIMPQDPWRGPYSISADKETVDLAEADVANLTLLSVNLPEDSHLVEIMYSQSSGIAPRALVEFDQIAYVGENIVFNASRSVDDGEIVTYAWDFGDGADGSGIVVSHSYAKKGEYLVLLRLIDNENLTNSTELTVTVKNETEPAGNEPQNSSKEALDSISIVAEFAVAAGGLAIALGLFFLRRKDHHRSTYRLEARNSAPS